MVPVRISNAESNSSCIVYGLLDSGADRDVISEKLVKRLGLPTRNTILKVVTVGNEITSERELADFTIESIDSDYGAEIEDALVGDILTSENDIPPYQH